LIDIISNDNDIIETISVDVFSFRSLIVEILGKNKLIW